MWVVVARRHAHVSRAAAQVRLSQTIRRTLGKRDLDGDRGGRELLPRRRGEAVSRARAFFWWAASLSIYDIQEDTSRLLFGFYSPSVCSCDKSSPCAKP